MRHNSARTHLNETSILIDLGAFFVERARVVDEQLDVCLKVRDAAVCSFSNLGLGLPKEDGEEQDKSISNSLHGCGSRQSK